MKSKHLLTFGFILALIGSEVLLREESSIAAKPSPVSRDRTKEQKPPSSSDPAPVPTPSVMDSPPPPTTTNAVSGATNSGNMSPLSITAGVLHLLEIAGIAWAYFQISKFTKKNNEEIIRLNNKLSASEKKNATQDENLRKIASNTVDAQKLISRVNAIEQATQQKSSDASYASYQTSYPVSFSDTTVAKVSTAPSPYPFLDLYRQSPDIFRNQYTPKTVSEDSDNFNRRWAGNQQEIILGEDRTGNYWLFNEGDLMYLIPVPKLKVNEIKMRTVGGLFDCNNHMDNYQSLSVIRPAIVSPQPGVKGQWKLEQKGVLDFT
jgi:hypothetical protein